MNRLTPLGVEREKDPGMYADGAGLYLLVGPTGAKSWIYRFMLKGRAHEMGLGALHTISLAKARQKALDARQKTLAARQGEGVDPLAERKAKKDAAKLVAARAKTFKQCAEEYIESNKAG